MLKICRDAWYENKDALEDVIRKDAALNSCDYKYLVKLIITHILNPYISEEDCKFNADLITVIDNGDYQGTQLFIIPRDTYQPGAGDYIMTCCYYGSCSVCDTLLSIQNWEGGPRSEEQVNDFMTLCRHLVCNIIKPYNHNWRSEEEFEEVPGFEE